MSTERPNERGAGNGAMTVLFLIARSSRAVPDRERWPPEHILCVSTSYS
jgi:hypothetical protein